MDTPHAAERLADPLNAQLRGVALWTLVCLGELSLREAAARVPVAHSFDPVPGEKDVYARNFREYKKLYGAVKGFYRRMNG